MAFSGSNSANIGPIQNIATVKVPIAGPGPNGETEGNALVVAGSLTATIDESTLATSANQVTQITAEQAIQATAGTTTGAAVTTDASGTIQQYLRGLVVLFVNFLSRLPAALGAGGGLKIDGSGTALPVSGTVTANLGTIGGAATEATLAAQSAKFPTNLGIKTAAGSLSIAPASDGIFVTNFGTVFGGADGLTNNNVIYVKGDSGLGYPMNANMVFNGTSWDRMRGSTAGLFALPGGHSFANITTATTTTVKSGAGVLHTVTVNNLGTVASTTTIYDNTAGSGTKIATINTLAGQETYLYDIAFTTGLTIVTTGTVAPDITVSYR